MVGSSEVAATFGVSRFRMALRIRLCALSAVVLLLLGTSAVVGDTLQVPSPAYPTIQAAIDAAKDGDTVQVAPGTYHENLSWWYKSIALVCAVPGGAIVDPGGSGRCLTMGSVPPAASVQGFTFTGGSASAGGGIYLYRSSPTLTDNTIVANSADRDGGGLYLYDSSPDLTSNTIADNSASGGWPGGGGGLYLDESSPTLTGNAITRNWAYSSGGGLYFEESSATLTRNTIADNSASGGWPGGGGGLYLDESSPTLTDNTITANSAEYGGGLGVWWQSSPTVTNNTITANSADHGGGLYVYKSRPTLAENTITDNSGEFGGGLDLYSSSPTLTSNTITDNSASRGGGLHLEYSSPALTENTVARNSADYYGGGLYLYVYSSPTLTDNTITANSAAYRGGGLYLLRASPALTDNTITANSATYGGGLYVCDDSSPTLTSNAIADNSADFGGGLYLSYASPALMRNAITANSASSLGGGLYLRGSSPALTNNTVTGNSGDNGAGLYLEAWCSPTLTSNTISSNAGGGLYRDPRYPFGAPVITNCILWGSTVQPDLENASATYSDIGSGELAGEGNISEDPLFVGGDYHLRDDSPCIDAGNNDAPNLPETDKDGNPRIVPPLTEDGVVDVGAYEWQGPTNRPPVAVDDLYSVPEDLTLIVDAPGVLANDSDPDEDELIAILVSQPSHGILTFYPNGAFTYQATSPDWNGTDTFTYKANDGLLDSNVATVTITVIAVNDAPMANDDSATTDEDIPVTIDVLANDTDVDGDTLTVDSVTQPANGTATNNGINVSYEPALNFNGTDGFTYTLSDGHGGTDTATVTVTVEPVNDAPVAHDQSVATDEDTPLAITLGATDVDGDPLTYSIVTPPAHGALSGAAPSLTYTPDENYNGADSFSLKANDGAVDSNVATVSITVNPVNDPPVARDDAHSLLEDTTLNVSAPGVLDNDTDVDNDPLTAELANGVSNGTLTLNTNGSFTYTPDPNFNGIDSFTYTASDGQGGTDTATVTITVNPINDAPVANDDSATTDEDVSVTIDVLANDTDVDGDTLTVDSVTQPANGTATNNGANVTYTPDPDFNGTDSFTYTASDGNGGTDTPTVTVTVNPVNDAPVGADDAYSVDEDNTLTVAARGVLGNDIDVDGDALTAVKLSDPGNGALTLGDDGSCTYTPDVNFNGTDSFTYCASDVELESDPCTVTITVNPVNDPPEVGAITAPVDPVPVGISIGVSASFSDPDVGDTHTAEWGWGDGSKTQAEVSVGPITASHTYTAAGVYTLILTVTDSAGASDTSVYQYVVAYDPSGGFVTGGGWIWSPEGAYAPDPSLTGKANFGFTAKYHKGADIPSGKTEFHFRVADLNFHSASYQWLVVAGARAKFKGSGTINGEGDYGFMLTAIDGQRQGGGGVDRFRIKIWDKAADEVIYDNQMGADEGSDAATALGGGSIVIHDGR